MTARTTAKAGAFAYNRLKPALRLFSFAESGSAISLRAPYA
jgi:hypothetical protein